ncbi:MAG: penicillin-binding protein activator LpoB [Kiritimatiellia bacterium]|nr:penicillin-binding protein activator LpoB [Lentisphaerota bacterium]
MQNYGKSIPSILIITAVLSLTGCAAFRVKVTDTDVDQMPTLDARYGAQDLRKLSQDVADELAASAFLQEQPERPVMIVYGVQPRTTTFVDTQALTDRIKTTLLRDGRAQFVNEARRDQLLSEQGYQAAQATEETRVAVGRQTGAKYMLTGALVEMDQRSGRQVRVSKTELVYYQLTIDVTDLETNLIVWSTTKEFARQARTPLIGW